MVSVVLFTFKRQERLITCLKSLAGSSSISEVLIFNDDESNELSLENFTEVSSLFPEMRVFNPSSFGFTGRQFRKHKYLNKSIDLAKENKIFFSDDDGFYTANAVDFHDKALDTHEFSAGGIVRSKLFRHTSKSILQGTNYGFRKSLLKELGGYDEEYLKSFGGGDAEFWYRIYNLLKETNRTAAFLPKVKQTVIAKSTRRGLKGSMDAKEYTQQKHNITSDKPMYKWFPEIRNKKKWMTVIK